MNRVTIIGNLVRDPETRTTAKGDDVTSFTVAVNRKNREDTDYFKVNAWNGNARSTAQYLRKGSKVAVHGSVTASAYIGKDNNAHSSLEIYASEIEFLSPKVTGNAPPEPAKDESTGFEKVETDLPF